MDHARLPLGRLGRGSMKNPFRSLPARIVAFVFAAVMLTSLTVMGLAINSIHSFLHDEIDRKFPAVLEARSQKLDHWYGQREREIEVFSQSEVVLGNLLALSGARPDRRRDQAVDEVEQYMRYVLDGFRQYSALYILDPSGRVLLWARCAGSTNSDSNRLTRSTEITMAGMLSIAASSNSARQRPVFPEPVMPSTTPWVTRSLES